MQLVAFINCTSEDVAADITTGVRRSTSWECEFYLRRTRGPVTADKMRTMSSIWRRGSYGWVAGGWEHRSLASFSIHGSLCCSLVNLLHIPTLALDYTSSRARRSPHGLARRMSALPLLFCGFIIVSSAIYIPLFHFAAIAVLALNTKLVTRKATPDTYWLVTP